MSPLHNDDVSDSTRQMDLMCAQAPRELVALIDGELPPAQTAEWEAHLAVCPTCTAKRDALVVTLARIGQTPASGIDVTDAVMDYIVQEIPGPTPARLAQSALPDVWAYRRDAEREGVPFINLERHAPESEALALLNGETARWFRVLPIKLMEQTLFVAMADPRDVLAIDAMRMETRCMVRPMQAAPERLRAAIDRAYPAEAPSEMRQLLDGMRAMQAELAAVRGELAELRRQVAAARGGVAKPVRLDSSDRLFPFAPPVDWAAADR